MSQSDVAPPAPSGGDLILYQTEDGRTRLQGETVWLSLDQMADLFQRDKSVIAKHIKNAFAEGELQPGATVAKFATVQTEGERSVEREIEFHNRKLLDAQPRPLDADFEKAVAKPSQSPPARKTPPKL